MTAAPTRPLETGWLPDTPVEDTLLRRFLHNQADHNEAMATAHGGRTERAEDVFLADSGSPEPFLNQAILARPILTDDEVALDTLDALLRGRRGVTLLSPWPTPDLTRRGWSLVGHPVLVVRSPAPVPDRTKRPGVEVRRATTATDLAAAERVAIEGYPLDDARDAPVGSVLPAALASSTIVVRLGELDGIPVAVGNAHVGHGVVNLSLGATLATARRRGVWEALVWARVAEYADFPAVAYTSDLSRPGFERMGFLPVTRFTLWAR